MIIRPRNNHNETIIAISHHGAFGLVLHLNRTPNCHVGAERACDAVTVQEHDELNGQEIHQAERPCRMLHMFSSHVRHLPFISNYLGMICTCGVQPHPQSKYSGFVPCLPYQWHQLHSAASFYRPRDQTLHVWGTYKACSRKNDGFYFIFVTTKRLMWRFCRATRHVVSRAAKSRERK